jgi:uncharacterized protein YbaR (Trm112 family)
MTIDEGLLEILRCPRSRAPLVVDGERLVSTDPKTRLAYRVEDGIPNMIADEAEPLEEAAWRELMIRHGVLAREGED